MALRSLLRKMPALGGRSWPTASRLVSTDLPPAKEGGIVYSEEALASQREEIKLMRAQFDEKMEEIRRATDSLDDILRTDAQDMETFRKANEKIRKACAVYLVFVCVPAAILFSMI
ncbi:hypothetical protein ACQ4PT_010881 [Festuca glaucescens]